MARRGDGRPGAYVMLVAYMMQVASVTPAGRNVGALRLLTRGQRETAEPRTRHHG
jgi:hypothetical protein